MMRPSVPAVFAEAFVDLHGLDCGLRLEEIADQIGLKVREVEADGFDGALIRVKGYPLGIVALNKDFREPGRRLFTLAHEIGHYLLPKHDEKSRPCRRRDVESWSSKTHSREKEANSFAAAILIPKASVTPLLLRDPEASDIKTIATTHRTSLTASAYRYVELSGHRTALVWSQAGRVVWYKTSDEFRRGVRKENLDRETLAYKCHHHGYAPNDFGLVSARSWFFDRNLKKGAEILEYSVPMPSYDAVLTLLYIPDPIESWTEWEDEYEESLSSRAFTLRRKRWPR